MDAPRAIRAGARDEDGAFLGDRRALAALLLGLAGAVLLFAAEVSTVASVEIPGHTCSEVANPGTADRCSLTGLERHGGAFLLLGALGVPMAFGAARGRSRPAALALVVIAVVVLAFALLRDLPEANETGAVGIAFEGAEGVAGPGLYLEIVAGLLLLAGGALALPRRP